MWSPRKTLVLHNSRETLARLLYRRIRHLCTAYKIQKCMSFLSQVCYVYDVPDVLRKMIQDDQIWQSYVQCGMMLWHLLTSFFALSLFCLKALLFFICMATFAQCTNQDSNCVYAGTILWHKEWYNTNMIWYVCNGRCRSLMCTSNVAGNTQMASLDRQVMQNRLGVINAIARGIYNGGIPR